MIHSTAIIHPKAEVPTDTEIGPYVVIDAGVRLGAGCVIGPHVYLTGSTIIGQGNRFHAGSVIGDAPQDLKYKGQVTRVRIGDFNVFRECVTVHRSATESGETVLGSHNYLMACSHVGHNSTVGNNVIMANGVLLGGHTEVHDRAFLSGNCLVHQFTRVGTLAIMQGGSAASKDVAPYTVVRGHNRICGLNVVGLRRAGLSPADRLEIKQLYRLLFRSSLNLRPALEQARQEFKSAVATTMLDFMAASKRGVCADVRPPSKASGEDEDGEE